MGARPRVARVAGMLCRMGTLVERGRATRAGFRSHRCSLGRPGEGAPNAGTIAGRSHFERLIRSLTASADRGELQHQLNTFRPGLHDLMLVARRLARTCVVSRIGDVLNGLQKVAQIALDNPRTQRARVSRLGSLSAVLPRVHSARPDEDWTAAPLHFWVHDVARKSS